MLLSLLGGLIANPLTLITAVSPFIAKIIQANAAAFEAQKDLLQSEMAAAQKTAGTLSGQMDKLVYLNQEVMYAVVDRELRDKNENPADSDTKLWKEYKEIWKEWNSNITTNTAKVAVSFGQEDMNKFHEVIRLFKTLDDELDSIYYDKVYYGTPKIDLKSYKRERYFKTLNSLKEYISKLSLSVFKKMTEQKVGSRLDEGDKVTNFATEEARSTP